MEGELASSKEKLTKKEKQEWYDNKDLFEMIQGLREDLQETRTVVKKYNGIRKDLSEVMERLTVIEEQKVGRSQAGQLLREWGGWLATITVLILRVLEVI